MTLGESDLSEGILANNIQFGWWLVPIRGSPSRIEELGILWILDQGDSWMKMMLNWFWISRRVLTMREFLWTFCERILRFFTIIVEVHHSPQNGSTWICYYGSQHIFFVTTPYYTYVSKTDIGWNLLSNLLDSLSIWMNEDMVLLSLFPTLEGWSCHSPCNTTQICDGFQTCGDHCIWHILILEFYTRKLCGPISNNSCIEEHLDSCLLLKLSQYIFRHWNIYWLAFWHCCRFEHPKCLSIQLTCWIWKIPWLLLAWMLRKCCWKFDSV